ncbi:hypothetical protein A3Q56_08133 [Intoshia linei]|uniref:Uncharacterized protein n=1 Tax=Intoshia linei TaxID=1819745 RepID=A0A177AS09_9BILA|nr:hypothetical protein A3Q56_08133 [Intoshia linei]
MSVNPYTLTYFIFIIFPLIKSVPLVSILNLDKKVEVGKNESSRFAHVTIKISHQPESTNSAFNILLEDQLFPVYAPLQDINLKYSNPKMYIKLFMIESGYLLVDIDEISNFTHKNNKKVDKK